MKGDLVRKTRRLSSTHIELVRLLAEIAVSDYLRDLDTAPTEIPSKPDAHEPDWRSA